VNTHPAPSTSTPTPKGPLSDVVVLDFTWMLAGPYCTMLLADLGARVIKIEPPGGDPMRIAGPFRDDDSLRAYGGYFQSINRNKDSVVLDLKRADGRDAVHRLVKRADMVVENFRAGVMDRLGVGYTALQSVNPALVYGSIRGYGDDAGGVSPHKHRPAVDVTIQAEAGLMGITGPGPGQPTKVGPGVGDIFPGALCAVGLLAALHHARRTGSGQYVDIAMYDSVLSLCERIVYQYSYSGLVSAPIGNAHPLFVPFDIFEAADGFVAISASDDGQWQTLARAMGRDELSTDARYRTAADRLQHADDVREIVAGWVAQRGAEQIVDLIGDGIPVGRVSTVRHIWEDPHASAREMLVEVDQPGCATPVTVAGCPIKLSKTASGIWRRAPLLGEHTRQVLAECDTRSDQW
jgi:crotonobetainyl-CoA:carnitine CoA-transferase CaiB-like acyl-CoA transferase